MGRCDLHCTNISTRAHPVLDYDNRDDDAKPPTTPPSLHDGLWRGTPLRTAAKSISRRFGSWRERTLDNFFPSPFKYAPIEMDDHSLGLAGSHSDEIELDRKSKHYMAGGSQDTGVQMGTSNAKTTNIMEEHESGRLSANNIVSLEGSEPTEEEIATLRKVADRMPLSAFIVALVELCERFTYYGLSGPFQNYIQYHPYDQPVRGGIGKTLIARCPRRSRS